MSSSKRQTTPTIKTPSTLVLSAGEEHTTAYLVPNSKLPADFHTVVVPVLLRNDLRNTSANAKVFFEHAEREREWSDDGFQMWEWSGRIDATDVEITHVVQYLTFC